MGRLLPIALKTCDCLLLGLKQLVNADRLLRGQRLQRANSGRSGLIFLYFFSLLPDLIQPII